MKDFSPVGCTRTPNPVSLSSQAIQDLSAGFSASMVRPVKDSLFRARRLLDGRVIPRPPCAPPDSRR